MRNEKWKTSYLSYCTYKETKRMINGFLVAIGLVACVFCVSCPPSDDPNPSPYNPNPSPYNEKDRLSIDSINQLIVKTEGWTQIVQNPALFQLSNEYTFSYNHTLNLGNTQYVFAVHNRSYGTFPAIDGSTVLLPLAVEFGWQYLDLGDRIFGERYDGYVGQPDDFFNFSTTHNAFLKLIGASEGNNTHGQFDEFIDRKGNTLNYNRYYFWRQPDIIFITSPSEAELGIAESRGVNLTVKPVCYDSFVFITHTENPVDTLTVEQIRDIYSGQITNWSEVGGADEEIVAFQRGAGSGSQTAMEEMVMDGISMMNAPIGWYANAMGWLIEFVAEYQNNSKSIGYTFKYYVDRLYINPNIKILKVNGIEPNDDNVRNETYPFVAPYNGVIRSSDSSNTGGRFLDWMLSPEGQRSIAQAGYVPVTR
jgi:phosphate transport system substrate-binding protein